MSRPRGARETTKGGRIPLATKRPPGRVFWQSQAKVRRPASPTGGLLPVQLPDELPLDDSLLPQPPGKRLFRKGWTLSAWPGRYWATARNCCDLSEAVPWRHTACCSSRSTSSPLAGPEDSRSQRLAPLSVRVPDLQGDLQVTVPTPADDTFAIRANVGVADLLAARALGPRFPQSAPSRHARTAALTTLMHGAKPAVPISGPCYTDRRRPG
jgi:hypothetical protein